MNAANRRRSVGPFPRQATRNGEGAKMIELDADKSKIYENLTPAIEHKLAKIEQLLRDISPDLKVETVKREYNAVNYVLSRVSTLYVGKITETLETNEQLRVTRGKARVADPNTGQFYVQETVIVREESMLRNRPKFWRSTLSVVVYLALASITSYFFFFVLTTKSSR
jgi:hypothetical protein